MLKLKYYFEWIFYFLLFSLVAIVQSTFISALPPVYSAINLPLVAILFCLLFFNRDLTLVMAFFMGFWLDILGFNFFSLNIIVLLSLVVLLDIVLRNWLTNRSLYSFLVLSVASVIVYNVLVHTLLIIVQNGQDEFGFFLFQPYFWKHLSWQIFWNTGSMLLFFNLANSLSKHLKPFFLEKK